VGKVTLDLPASTTRRWLAHRVPVRRQLQTFSNCKWSAGNMTENAVSGCKRIEPSKPLTRSNLGPRGPELETSDTTEARMARTPHMGPTLAAAAEYSRESQAVASFTVGRVVLIGRRSPLDAPSQPHGHHERSFQTYASPQVD
jgi:hypothetical protein